MAEKSDNATNGLDDVHNVHLVHGEGLGLAGASLWWFAGRGWRVAIFCTPYGTSSIGCVIVATWPAASRWGLKGGRMLAMGGPRLLAFRVFLDDLHFDSLIRSRQDVHMDADIRQGGLLAAEHIAKPSG